MDGVLATDQLLNQPFNVAVDQNGNIYIPGGNIIRKISAQTGIITTVVGSLGMCKVILVMVARQLMPR